MVKLIRDTYITVSEIDEDVCSMVTSDGRQYIALKNMYGHWFLYEGNDVDAVIDAVYADELIHCGFGYTLDMCVKSIPTIQIRAWFGNWKWVNDEVAIQFINHLFMSMNGSESIKRKMLTKHVKGEHPAVLLRRRRI